ncbi:MAG: RsbRD N-terminal domain-containing protein [Desulfofustis sp.]|nr:RsbRD N-terminal domain-containing protein [Desulfofustis sp.]
MKLEEALHNNRYKIVDRWVKYTLETYKASQFFTREKDSFANPIGGTVRDSLRKIFSLLIKNQETANYKEPLSRLMHLRSVQEFTPSQAVAPLNAVKHITRDVLAADKETKLLIGELYDFEFSVDLAVLAAFDLYVECREKIYKIRVEEIRSGKELLTDGACPSKALKNITDITR